MNDKDRALSRDFLQRGRDLMGQLFKAPTPEPSAKPLATVADLARLNVVFMDNENRPLYAAGTASLGVDHEKLVIQRAIASVREIREPALTLGDPPAGMYSGKTLAEVIDGLSSLDVRRFFSFVRDNPRFFINKPLRFSEAFVSWIIDRGTA